MNYFMRIYEILFIDVPDDLVKYEMTYRLLPMEEFTKMESLVVNSVFTSGHYWFSVSHIIADIDFNMDPKYLTKKYINIIRRELSINELLD